MNDYAIEVEGLRAGYRDHEAVTGITFAVRPGRLAGILGPNGSGKSTLAKALIGLLQPWSGTVRVMGQPPSEARGHVGYVPQSQEVDWDFPVTVRDVVAMGLYRRTLGLDRFRRADGQAIQSALERMDVAQMASRQVGELSGGQQRRVLLARALVRDPEVLLLDEPAAGLDVPAEEELLRLLRGMADEGKTVVMATHDIQGVLDTFDDALLINREQIAWGPADEALTDEALHEAFGRQLMVFHTDGHHHVEQHHVAGEEGRGKREERT